ncbi:MAG: TolC family protein [candidate division Zixibacteria bacterium]|nr:TolC family protein [candidate division Zixibacteria bacterium]
MAAASTLSLADALETALRDSLTAELAGVERSQGKQALAEGVASATPDLSAAYSTSGSSVAEVGSTWRFGFSLTQPVVDATVVFDVMRGVREKDYYRAKSGQTFANLILDVQRGYYDLARAQALVASAEGQYRRALENVKTVERRYQLGEVSLADKLRAEADFLTKETDLLSARNGVEENQRAFSDLIGLAGWEAIAVEELPPPEEPLELPTTVISAALLEKNPDLTVLGMQVGAADVAYWGAWGNLLPALSFSYSRGSTFGGAIFPGEARDEKRYGVVVSLPVVDVTARVLGITGARLDRKQSRLELAQARLESRERVASLLATQELSYKGWESASKTVELNEEVYRLNARSYELGAVSFDDLLQVEAELTQAERALVQAKADYWSSRAELNYLLGTSVEEK